MPRAGGYATGRAWETNEKRAHGRGEYWRTRCGFRFFDATAARDNTAGLITGISRMLAVQGVNEVLTGSVMVCG